MKKLFVTSMAMVLALAFGAFAADDKDKAGATSAPDPSSTNSTLKDGQAQSMPMTAEGILNKLHSDNLKEVEQARLLESKSDNKDVQELASALLREHEQADKRVREIAQAKNITLKETEADHGATSETAPFGEIANRPLPRGGADLHEYGRLYDMSGPELDREYTTLVASRHHKLLLSLDRASNEISDEQVKSLIGEVEPAIRQHAERASFLARQFGAKVVEKEERPQTNR